MNHCGDNSDEAMEGFAQCGVKDGKICSNIIVYVTSFKYFGIISIHRELILKDFMGNPIYTHKLTFP